MKPFILAFKESSLEKAFDFSKIKYCDKLNLSVDTETGLPAISFLNLSTGTFTKVYNETSDSDDNFSNIMMGTLTKTSYQVEGTDDDSQYNSVKSMMATSTLTLVSQEASDSDDR